MNISRRKIEFIQDFLNLENEDLISQLEKILHTASIDDDKLFQPMSEKELNRRIDQSIEDAKNGKLTNVEDLLNEIDGWN